MDIYKFFNSKDEAKYLKSLDYHFSLSEAAYVIYQSKYVTMDERVDAWQELIDTMPDTSLLIRDERGKIESFRAFLQAYIKLQKKMVGLFSDSKDAVYTYELYEREPFSIDDRYEDEHVIFIDQGDYFGTAEAVFADYQKNLKYYQDDGVKRVRFNRHSLATEPGHDGQPEMCMETNLQMQILTMKETYIGTWEGGAGSLLNDDEEELLHTFERMNFSFPTPFRKGDILINRVMEMEPDCAFGPLVFLGDSSNMNYQGYYLEEAESRAPMIDERNSDYTSHFGINDTYMDLERYDGPLLGVYRALKPLSQMMTINPETGNSMISEELGLNACHQIMAEEMCKSGRTDFEAANDKIKLEQVGFKKSTKKNYYLP